MQLIKRAFRTLLYFLGGSAALLILLWITISHWVPVVASHYLPKPLKLSFSEPRISYGQLDIASISITANNCTLVQLNSTRFSVFPLHAIVDGLDVKTECLSALEPTNETVNEPINIAEFIDNLPVFSLVIIIPIYNHGVITKVVSGCVKIRLTLYSLILEGII